MAQFPSTASASDVWNVTDVYRAVAGGNWPSLPAQDPYFEYVSMLLPGNGTNGAQNNTFLDSSTNNFTITRNGNTTQGSFSPYGDNWSNYFGGTGNYLTTATSASGFSFGTGDFTIEFWINSTQTTRCDPIGQNNTFSSSGWWGLIGNLSSSGQLQWFENANSRISATATNWNNGSWNHIAVTRSGNSVRMFVNGTQVGSTYTTSFTYGASSVGVIAGVLSDDKTTGPLTGYLSNFRIVKGTALYTGTFTPSTTPLTAVSGTSLLTCQANRFFDASTNALAITTTGSPSVQRFSPFSPTAAYSTSVIGGSGYFDGSGDTLTTSTSQIIPTGSFTVECWAYVTGSGANQKFVSQGSSGAAGRFSVGIEGGNWFTQLAGDVIQTGAPVRNQWNYVAVTYNGSTITLYVNGTSIGTVSSTANAQNTTLTIGQDWNSYIVTGYVADVRISNTVRTITVPTAPYSSDGSTRLLLSMTNGAIFDNAMMNDLETVGNAQISTSVVKYGTGSLAFDGTGDWLTVPYGPTQNFGTGAFTIEMWAYLNSLSASYYVPAGTWGSGTSDEWLIQIQNNGNIRFLTTSGSTFYSASITTATWYHIAVVRNGSTVTIYVNGTSVGSYTCTNSLGSTAKTLYIGTQAGTWDWNGYIDDFRITNGVARYTANFTPPTAAFPTY